MLKQIFQIFIDIQAIGFGHLNHGINHGAGIRAFGSIAEQPVAAAYRERTDRILAQIVGKAAPAVLQVCHELLPVILGIVHRFLKARPFFRGLL